MISGVFNISGIEDISKCLVRYCQHPTSIDIDSRNKKTEVSTVEQRKVLSLQKQEGELAISSNSNSQCIAMH